MNFAFGSKPATSSAPGLTGAGDASFSFGMPAQPAGGTGSTGFSFNAPATAAAPNPANITSTEQPAPAPAPAPTSSGFTIGGQSIFGASSTTQSSGFNLGGSVASTAVNAPVSTSAGAQISLPATTATGTATISQVKPLFGVTGFSVPSTTPATSATVTSTPNLGLSGAQAKPVATSSIAFSDLEESLNKWTINLEEQEKVFMNQALQLNAWDKLLIENGDRVLQLNAAVEGVKQEQEQLDHELDFISWQQRELEESLVPLEKETANVSATDPERQHTYQLAENVDGQLKQLSEDLKEVIDYLNETNANQQTNDPIVKIGKILNNHMMTLQWIDRNTATICNHLDQIDKLHETHRREHEKSFQLSYE